jgi:hypothetical protein
MEWKDVLSKISDAAPMIGSLFGAPGTLAGTVVKLVATTLGVEPTQDAIAAEIKNNPDALLKLRELEASHQIELQKLTLETERVRLADVADARAREKAVMEKTGYADINLYVLAWVMIIGFFVLMGLLIFRPLPEDSSGVVMMLFGSLAAAFGAVIQYFFGSSAGSAAKTTMLNQSRESKDKG